MSDVLLIEHEGSTVEAVERTLRTDGHVVWTTSSAYKGLEFLSRCRVDAVITTLDLRDMIAFDLLRVLRSRLDDVPVFVLACGDVNDALSAIQLGATDCIGKPISEEKLRHALDMALSGARNDLPARPAIEMSAPQPHAAARWARAVVPIVDSRDDPRTIAGWSRCIAASPGAIRNWCFTAGIGPRQSLVFGRLLRAVVLSEGGRHKPENLLDVVDRRTLVSLLRLGGFDQQHAFPTRFQDFLHRQVLVRDTEALRQIERALIDRRPNLRMLSASA
jgi:CheY-like chemotaxis protein